MSPPRRPSRTPGPVPGPRRRPIFAAGIVIAVLLLSTLATTGPAAADGPPGATLRSDGPLTGRLLALEASPKQARALSVTPSGPGSPLRAAGGDVLVTVRLTDTRAATLAALGALGEVVSVVRELRRATVRISPDRLSELGALPALIHADVVPAPIMGASTAAAGPARPTAGCRPVVSEADKQLKAARARAEANVDGTGVMVGVLSDSYDAARTAATTARQDVASGDLPGRGNPCGRSTPVRVLDDIGRGRPGATDEGRAMLQDVHDLAPGASLAFATATDGPDAFAANIRALARAGADVIVDDITYLTEPFFQSGVIDRAVSSVVRRGVTYLSSAGNSNLVVGGRDAGSWETPRTRLTDCPALDFGATGYPEVGQCVSFGSAVPDAGYGLTVAAGGSITPVLQWAEPEGGVNDDFDLFVVDAATKRVLASSTVVQARSQAAVEFLSWNNTGPTARSVEIVVNRLPGSLGTPRLKLVLVSASGVTRVEHDRSVGGDIVGPTVFGHNGGPDVISVAAVPYDDASTVEPYSSHGPVTHYFAPVTGTRPAKALPAPRVVRVPQVAATDGTANTFFGPVLDGARRFYGTSAAAPAAAGVAALLRQARPQLTAPKVLHALQHTATRVGTAPAYAVGAGLLNARKALRYVAAPAAPSITSTRAKVGAAVVSFTPPRSDPRAAPPTSYRARCTSGDGPAGVTTRVGPSTAPIRVTGLTRGKSYRCKVRAATAYAAGVYSARGAAVVVRGVPSRPTRIRVEARPRAARVSFRPPTNTGGLPLLGYLVTCTPTTDVGRPRTKRTAATTVRVARLRPRVPYTCAVEAVNKVGPGRQSTPSPRMVPEP